MNGSVVECPDCSTLFRVTDAQLAAASGLVRCGACLGIFRAADSRVSDPVPEPMEARQEPAREDSDRIQARRHRSVLDTRAHGSTAGRVSVRAGRDSRREFLPAGGQPSRPAAARSLDALQGTDLGPSPDMSPDRSLDFTLDLPGEPADEVEDPDASGGAADDAHVAHRNPPATIPLLLSEAPDVGPASERADPVPEIPDFDAEFGPVGLDPTNLCSLPADEGFPHRVFRPAPSGRGRRAAAEAVRSSKISAVEFSPADVAAETISSAAPAFDGQPDRPPEPSTLDASSASVPAAEAPAGPLATRGEDGAALARDAFEPELVPAADGFGTRLWRWRWSLAALLVLSAVSGRWLAVNFEALALAPETRGYMAQLCDIVGCELPARVDPGAIRSQRLLVHADPDRPGALRAELVLVNRAAWPQPFPDLELQFSTIRGETVASERFSPAEYLGGELRGASEMPPGSPIRIALQLADPGEEAVNYELRLHRAGD